MTKKGFTLLEVMVALGIIAISISSILTSMATGASLPYDSKQRFKAVDLSVMKLHDIERLLIKDGFKDEDVEEHGDFEDEDFREYSWIARIKKIEIPDDIAMLSKMFLGGGSDEDATAAEQQKNTKEAGMMSMFGSLIQMIKDTFEAAIREVEIEVYWYNGGKEEENREKFVLVTHIIDFTALNKLPDLGAIFGGATSKSTNTNTNTRTGTGNRTGTSIGGTTSTQKRGFK